MTRLVSADTWAVMTIFQEARSEPYDGKVAVGRVIRNRMKRLWSGYGDVVDTVLWPYQFSGWNTGDLNRRVSARMDDTDPQVQDCQKAWAESLMSDGGVGDAVFYYNPAGVTKTPEWATDDKFVVRIGAHKFYRG